MTAEEKAKVGPGFVFSFFGAYAFFLIGWLCGGGFVFCWFFLFVCLFCERCHLWVPPERIAC